MVSKSFVRAASSLLAAISQVNAQNPLPARISINTGPPVAGITPGVLPPGAALVGTGIPQAAPASTIRINVGGIGGNGTGVAAPQQSRTPGAQNVWVIRVGSTNGSLAFSPDTITGAQVGDQIQFQFYPRVSAAVLRRHGLGY